MIKIKDGKRTLEFEGTLLAHSSSQSNSGRWIEFFLYKTTGGTYILHRIGKSYIVHSNTCHLVKKYSIKDKPNTLLQPWHVRCEDCWPSFSSPFLCFEEDRHWTLRTEEAESVVDSLYKTDPQTGASYLTRVAAQLVEEAAEKDEEISAAYYVEFIE